MQCHKLGSPRSLPKGGYILFLIILPPRFSAISAVNSSSPRCSSALPTTYRFRCFGMKSVMVNRGGRGEARICSHVVGDNAYIPKRLVNAPIAWVPHSPFRCVFFRP